MPDAYGNVVPSDLQAVVDHFTAENSALVEMVRNLHRVMYSNTPVDAKVLKHAKLNTPEEKAFGVGAVQLEIPRHDITFENNFWASPHRTLQGRFDVPPVGSWVRVIFRDGRGELAEYYGAKFQDVTSGAPAGTTNAEQIGFEGPTPGDLFGGPRLTEARTRPDSLRLLESSDGILVAEDSQSKKLEVRTAQGWETHLTAGPGGKVVIGAYDPLATSEGSGTDVEIVGGDSGNLKVTLKNGNIELETDSDVTIKASGKITLDGDTEVKGTLKATDEVTAFHDSPSKVSLSKHPHPTAVPGPPSPPTPGT